MDDVTVRSMEMSSPKTIARRLYGLAAGVGQLTDRLVTQMPDILEQRCNGRVHVVVVRGEGRLHFEIDFFFGHGQHQCKFRLSCCLLL
jgi:hypothetical protein